MTLTDRINRAGSYRHTRPQQAERVIVDALMPQWAAMLSDRPRCAHCGEQLDHTNTLWRQAIGHVWYALCADRTACSLRAHGGSHDS